MTRSFLVTELQAALAWPGPKGSLIIPALLPPSGASWSSQWLIPGTVTSARVGICAQKLRSAANHALKQFVAGEPVDMAWFQEWLDLIERSTEQGRLFSRVRVVTVPLTDYS
jgi:hypothetical protein